MNLIKKVPPIFFNQLRLLISWLCVISLFVIIIHLGYRIPMNKYMKIIYYYIAWVIVFLFFVDSFIGILRNRTNFEFLRKNLLDVTIIALILFTFIPLKFIPLAILLRQAVIAIRTSAATRSPLEQLNLKPAQLLVLSFITVIILGMILLTFPTATSDGKGCPLLTALFTATSATCVTGLIIEDTPEYFSLFGQLVILCLIQIGGLGIMTISAFLVLMLGQRLGMRQQKEIETILERPGEIGITRILTFILKTTFLIEAVGALLLFPGFRRALHDPVSAAYFSVFHSVSAFCNAGFSLFSDSLTGFQNDIIINITMVSLIMLGGFGFIVLWNIKDFHNSKLPFKQRWAYLNTHIKIVIVISLSLICIGTLIIFFFEFENENTMLDLSVPTKLLASLFQSVTTRTAGFNTISTGALKPVTLFIMCFFMFVGASPGSTGGGIKTCTLAILLLAVKSTLQNRADVEVFHRLIPRVLVYKAVTIAVASAAAVGLYTSVLLITQEGDFLPILFETVSAFGTVGLSTGITPTLNSIGKFLIITLMFIGRIGPLTMAFALSKKQVHSVRTYPIARIMVG